jgi:hypothetical protein
LSLREQISGVVCGALEPLPDVLAGWEGGSAAFGAVDSYSDIDLFFLVNDGAKFEQLYATVAASLRKLSPITACHDMAAGRYYQLKAAGEYLMVDLCLLRVSAPDRYLDVERHGRVRPLFDKGEWLHPRSSDLTTVANKREERRRELQEWFIASQIFVNKAIRRGHRAEALAAYWAATLKPLAELLRMRHSPARWDFGMRYMDRDLPPATYQKFCDLMFVRDLMDLEAKRVAAGAWGAELLRELEPSGNLSSTC